MASSIEQRNLNQLLRGHPDDETELPLKCMYCCTEIRIRSFYELRKGNHIKQPGENLSFNIGTKLKKLYDHRSIIKEIHGILGSKAILTLIEFNTSPFNGIPKVQEQTVMKDLHHDEIILIKYRHNTDQPDEIIRRGESLIRRDVSYSLLFCKRAHSKMVCLWTWDQVSSKV